QHADRLAHVAQAHLFHRFARVLMRWAPALHRCRHPARHHPYPPDRHRARPSLARSRTTPAGRARLGGAARCNLAVAVRVDLQLVTRWPLLEHAAHRVTGPPPSLLAPSRDPDVERRAIRIAYQLESGVERQAS